MIEGAGFGGLDTYLLLGRDSYASPRAQLVSTTQCIECPEAISLSHLLLQTSMTAHCIAWSRTFPVLQLSATSG